MTFRPAFLAFSLLGLLAPRSAAAQDDQRPEPSFKMAPGVTSKLQIFATRRARLGITVNLQARDTDSIGALVQGVTPGGPAATAGIRTGDLIVRLNGKSVLESPNPVRRDQSAPSFRLIELASALEPNDTVQVEFRRARERRTVSLVTADEPYYVYSSPGPDRMYTFEFPDGDSAEPPPPGTVRERFPGGPEGPRLLPREKFLFVPGSPLADLELAPLNPDLGRYFGVSEGILVISVPADSKLGLKGGDVILTVDGRKPTSPFHLIRILRSYEEGEEFKIELVRMKRRETITARLR